MKFSAQVLGTDGKALASGRAELVSLVDGEERVVSGTIRRGQLKVTAEPGPVWGLRIDGRAVLALPLTTDGQTVDLGELVLLQAGVRWPVFHAPDGQIFGLPKAASAAGLGAKAAGSPARAAALGDAALPDGGVLKAGMTFGDAFGSTARQFGDVAAGATNFTMTGATVKLKGLPTSTGEALGLDFPTADLAATGQGLSELTFSLKPAVTLDSNLPPPTGPRMLDVSGYTRELAVRKVTAAGYSVEVNSEIVTQSDQVGRVVRQLPRAGTNAAAGGLVRLFIGKTEGS